MRYVSAVVVVVAVCVDGLVAHNSRGALQPTARCRRPGCFSLEILIHVCCLQSGQNGYLPLVASSAAAASVCVRGANFVNGWRLRAPTMASRVPTYLPASMIDSIPSFSFSQRIDNPFRVGGAAEIQRAATTVFERHTLHGHTQWRNCPLHLTVRSFISPKPH